MIIEKIEVHQIHKNHIDLEVNKRNIHQNHMKFMIY